MIIIKKLFLFTFLITNLNAQYPFYLKNKVEVAQNELSSSLNQLIKINALNKKTNINPQKASAKSEGLKILNLIEIFEENPTQQSILVLDRLHNLYYLEFYKLINDLKITEAQKVAATSTLSDLFLPNIKKPELQTFKIRTVITKAFIQMIVINKTISFHQTRKDAIRLMLDIAKQEILGENKNLNKKSLDAFFNCLELNAPQALVSKTTKYLLISSATILTITIVTIIISIAVWKLYLGNKLNRVCAQASSKYNEIKESAEIKYNTLSEKVGDEGIQERYDRSVNEMIRQLTESLIDGVKRSVRQVDAHGNAYGSIFWNRFFNDFRTGDEVRETERNGQPDRQNHIPQPPREPELPPTETETMIFNLFTNIAQRFGFGGNGNREADGH